MDLFNKNVQRFQQILVSSALIRFRKPIRHTQPMPEIILDENIEQFRFIQIKISVCYASVSCWAQHLGCDALVCCSHIRSVENHLNDNRFTFGKNCICSGIMHQFIASKGHAKWSMKFRKYCFLLIIFLNEFFIACTMNDSIFLVYACVLVQVTNLPFKFLHLAVQRD